VIQRRGGFFAVIFQYIEKYPELAEGLNYHDF